MDRLKVESFSAFEDWKGLRVREHKQLESLQKGDYGMGR
jgi:hypothetical protein